MLTNATVRELMQALAKVNKKYDNNISFNRLEQISKNRAAFTLKAKSRKKGSRFSQYTKFMGGGRRYLPCASWHVHGHFFDALFSIKPDVYILSRGKRITKEEGNWEDINIGSTMEIIMFSNTSLEQDLK